MAIPPLLPATRLVAATLLVFCAGAASAGAQIYSWTDASGITVYSDRPRPGSGVRLPLYAVPNAPGARATTFAPPGRSRAYDTLIDEHARRHGVRPGLVRAVIQVESAFDANARSPKGAMGLMQLMPSTAAALGVTDPFDPRANIGGGVRYLRQLLDRYGQDERLALAAYNAGPGAVDRYGERVPPYRETVDYVRKVDDLAGTARRAPAAATPSRTRIYRIVEVVDGREIVRYTDRAPR